MERKLERLGAETLFLKLELADSKTVMFIGSKEKISDDLGVDAPLLDKTLLLLAEDSFPRSKASFIKRSEASNLMKRVNDSFKSLIIY